MTNATQTASITPPKRFQCRHIHADGRRCGSPSLRQEVFCYYHHTSRPPLVTPRVRRSRKAAFDLHLPDSADRTGIQVSVGNVLRGIASNQIDPRRAGLLLYGLQIASLNLPRLKPAASATEQPIVEDLVADPNLGPIAPSTELPDPDAPRPNNLIARLLEELRRGCEIEAQTPTPEPATLTPKLVIPGEVEDPAVAPPLEPALPSEVDEPAVPPVLEPALPSEFEKPAVPPALEPVLPGEVGERLLFQP